MRGTDLSSLPALVKRTALAAYPRERVASLSGEAWLEFLDRTGGTREFTDGAGRLLIDLAYDPSLTLPESEIDGVNAVARAWILRHNPAASPGAEVGA